MILLLITCIWWVQCLCVISDPSDMFQVARRAQRDITVNQTIDQLIFTGLNMNKVIWNSQGYTTATLDSMVDYLDKGVNILIMDLYWNENWQNWQLCPAALMPNVTSYSRTQRLGEYECQLGLNLTTVFQSIDGYLTNTNNELDVNILELFLNLKSLNSNYRYTVSAANNSIANTLSDNLSNLYTPIEIQEDIESGALEEGKFPTLNHFLYKRYKRVVPIVLSNQLNPNSTYGALNSIDLNTVFVNGDNVNVTTVSTHNSTLSQSTDIASTIYRLSNEKFRMVIDDESKETNSTYVEGYLLEGYSAVLNTRVGSSELLLSMESLWSWISDQPDSTSPLGNTHANLTTNRRQVAYRCAVYYQTGWVVDNCYNKRYVACQNDTSVYDWTLSDDEETYFDADCPDGYSVGVPKSPLESLAMRRMIEESGILEPVWIDMNSITVDGCWVSGGPYASCPYRTLVTRKLFVGMITPASAVLFILIALIIALRFDSTPIQQNRKHWKRLVNEFNEKDYEGVPS